MRLIAISNHNKLPSRKREVAIQKQYRNNGSLFFDTQTGSLKSFEPSYEIEFRIFYSEEINGNVVRDSLTRTQTYTASKSDRIGFVNNELKYLDDPEFPNFQYYPTEIDFLIELEDTNQFTIAGQKHSLPKVPDGNGGQREMTKEEITELFVANLDTRESGSVFIEL